MKKQLSLIYQYYLLTGLPKPYMATLFLEVLFITIHFSIFLEIISKINLAKKWTFFNSDLFQNRLIVFLGFLILVIFLILYKKEKLLEYHFEKNELKRGISILLIYFGFLFITLLVLQFG